MPQRPLIAIPARYNRGVIKQHKGSLYLARSLADATWQAGGEPLILRPGDPTDPDARNWAQRLTGISGVLLPGGSDINPALYGGNTDEPSLYGVDDTQDAADLSLARYALDAGIPILGICRGHQMLNVALGGTLIENMPAPHAVPYRHTVTLHPKGQLIFNLPSDDPRLEVVCSHHQAIKTLGEGMTVIATADDGTIEATLIDAPAYAATVQWHPEYGKEADTLQIELLRSFINAARTHNHA